MATYTTGNTTTKVIVTAKEELDSTVNKILNDMEVTIESKKDNVDEFITDSSNRMDSLKSESQNVMNNIETAVSRISSADNKSFEIHDYDFTYNTETKKYEYILTHNLGDLNIQWTLYDINGKVALGYLEPKYGSNVNKALVKVRVPQYIKVIANRGIYGGIN